MNREIAFSLGSNLGDRVRHLTEARRAILATGDARERARSALYETEPVDVAPAYQHLKFINAVLIIETAYSAHDWLEWIDRIEREQGRERNLSDRNAPRDIDIDILYAGSDLIDSGGLVVPHPRWAARRFVVQPLADLRPDLVLPGSRCSVSEQLNSLGGADELVKLTTEW